MPIKVNDDIAYGLSDYYYLDNNEDINVLIVGGFWADTAYAGLNRYDISWDSEHSASHVGTRIVRTPIQSNP